MDISITNQIIKFSINILNEIRDIKMSHIHSIWKVKIIHRILKIIVINKVCFNSLSLFIYGGLVQIYKMFKSTTSTWPMTFHTTPITLIFNALWWFSATAHYFVQPLEDKTLVHNILWTYAFNIAIAGAHSKHNICVFYYTILIVGWF